MKCKRKRPHRKGATVIWAGGRLGRARMRHTLMDRVLRYLTENGRRGWGKGRTLAQFLRARRMSERHRRPMLMLCEFGRQLPLRVLVREPRRAVWYRIRDLDAPRRVHLTLGGAL